MATDRTALTRAAHHLKGAHITTPSSAPNTASAAPITGVLCVEDHEHIRAVMCVLTRGPRVVLARRSVLRPRAQIGIPEGVGLCQGVGAGREFGCGERGRGWFTRYRMVGLSCSAPRFVDLRWAGSAAGHSFAELLAAWCVPATTRRAQAVRRPRRDVRGSCRFRARVGSCPSLLTRRRPGSGSRHRVGRSKRA
jgi:hypothetical protein